MKVTSVPPKKADMADFQVDKIVKTIHQLLVRDLERSNLDLPDAAVSFIRNNHGNAFVKKYIMGGHSNDTRQKAFDKFHLVNSHMGALGFSFPSAPYVTSGMSPYDQTLIRAQKICYDMLTPLEDDEFFLNCKNSAGSSLGVPFSDTSVERKFSFPITITRTALPLFRHYLSHDSLLCESIVEYNDRHPMDEAIVLTRASRATTVPKTNAIDRMIAVEPTGNMFLQQGLMESLYSRMKSYGLDVATLPYRHKRMARKASIDGKYATIDFSSASDCLSIELLRYLLPDHWFKILCQVRCDKMSFEGQDIHLNMMSTMGNATTFPLETIVFYCLAMGNFLTHERASISHLPFGRDKRIVSVFGDDCIVPTPSAVSFMDVATKVGFIVNSEKSFFDKDDRFRESCGGDYLSGIDVRPYCLKGPTSQKRSALEPWLYIVFNSILTKYKHYFGELSYLYEKHVFRYLFSLFRRYKLYVKLVPDDYPDDSGLKISQDIARFRLTYACEFSRIKKDLHGSYTFLHCSFRYRYQKKQCEPIRYALRLKALAMREEQVPSILDDPGFSSKQKYKFVKLRRIGGYVVVKGSSGLWSFDP